ncbi:cyclic-phosphate processing receiver domain-containing protein [Paraburkholderia sp. 40]|uniref:cyclic-phosphate processing receiver domain-containing protein n=1 Tax=Paraburkholderia sp. 40 TaxID=2991059 RepID=UPI003D240B33
MPYRLFVDDLRDPGSPAWVDVRDSMSASGAEADGCPDEIPFDHDLGGTDTAMPIVKRLIELDLDVGGQFIPTTIHFAIHSANPVGEARAFVEGSFPQNKVIVAVVAHSCKQREEISRALAADNSIDQSQMIETRDATVGVIENRRRPPPRPVTTSFSRFGCTCLPAPTPRIDQPA